MILNLKKVLLTTLLTCAFFANAALVINEVDYDQAGADTAEFIELYNNGAVAVDMTGYTLELFNGSGAQSLYQTLNLPAQMLAVDSYFVICTDVMTVANCDLDTLNAIQNGAPDGMALRDATTAVIDALSYEGVATAPYSEGTSAPTDIGNAANADMGISRAPNGTDTNDNGADFIYKSITPGAANTLPPPSFSIDDVIQVETDSGTTNFIFTVTISATANATVDWTTSDGTATTTDSDYVAVAATTLTFTSGGATTQTVTVVVNGDTTIETDETFNVNLTNATGGAIIADALGLGTITNDDSVQAILSAIKSVSGDLRPNGIITYTIAITNTGPNAQNDNPGDEMTDTLPASLAYVSASATSGTVSNVGNIVSWNGSIAAGATETVTIVAQVNSGVAGSIENTATVSYDNDGDNTNESTAASASPTAVGPTAFFIPFKVPSLGQFALLLLMLSLVSVVYHKTRKNG